MSYEYIFIYWSSNSRCQSVIMSLFSFLSATGHSSILLLFYSIFPFFSGRFFVIFPSFLLLPTPIVTLLHQFYEIITHFLLLRDCLLRELWTISFWPSHLWNNWIFRFITMLRNPAFWNSSWKAILSYQTLSPLIKPNQLLIIDPYEVKIAKLNLFGKLDWVGFDLPTFVPLSEAYQLVISDKKVYQKYYDAPKSRCKKFKLFKKKNNGKFEIQDENLTDNLSVIRKCLKIKKFFLPQVISENSINIPRTHYQLFITKITLSFCYYYYLITLSLIISSQEDFFPIHPVLSIPVVKWDFLAGSHDFSGPAAIKIAFALSPLITLSLFNHLNLKIDAEVYQ